MPATMSILGLYQWDDTIFESMQVPEGFTNDDKDNLIDNILVECAELEFLYPSPEAAAWCIDRWSRKELPTWQRIYNVSVLEYNPIENYNRTEISTETQDNSETHAGSDSQAHTGTDTETHSGSDTETNSGTDTSSNSSTTVLDGTDKETHSGTDTTTIKKAAFDTNTLVDTESQATANGHVITKDMDDTTTVTDSGSMVHGHVITDQHGHIIANQHGETVTENYGHIIAQENEITRESHISGNIGVTTSQQMAESEVNLAPKLNVMNYIINSFKNRFCLGVY